MKKIFLLILALVVTKSYSQSLDQLFNEYVQMKDGTVSTSQADKVSFDCLKSGFGLCGLIKTNFDKFTPDQQKILEIKASRPETQTSVVTPLGRFRVHYDTDGTHALGYDLNGLLAALDSVYEYEINTLGYPLPPVDNNEGGDNLYDIYIQNLGRGNYGYTEFETQIGEEERYISYTVIENDFTNFYTSGLDAARVTAAHEYHHAIQIGNYIWRSDDLYYYETTSTSMEEFVFDYVNDYYAMMSKYFNRTSLSISKIDGYSFTVYNIFLKEKYGVDVIKRVWELMVQMPAVRAMDQALRETGTDLKTAFNTFGVWMFYTGDRAKAGYFDEAAHYPLVRSVASMEINPPQTQIMVSTTPVSNNFIQFFAASDTITVLVTNMDIDNGADSPYTLTQIDYSIYNSEQDNTTRINSNYYALLESSRDEIFTEALFLNDDFIGDEPLPVTEDPFPVPFRYSKHTIINIPANADPGEEVSMNIYSSGLDLVYDKNLFVPGSGNIEWNALKHNGEKLSSGVYVYVIKRGSNVKKGKLVIFND